MWNYLRGWLACAGPPIAAAPAPKVTVLIPARNEANQIADCLQCIAAQQGLSHEPEVIVIDDHSTDNTASIVLALAETLQHQLSIRLLRLADFPGLQLEAGFKKQALSFGITEAQGEIIITTDADCQPVPKWLATVTAHFNTPEVLVVAGPVLFAPYQSLLERFQALDFCGTMGLTAAGIHQGWQHLANGANLSFRKSIWRGYQDNLHLSSGDDMFFIQEIARRSPGSIRFAKSPDAVVYTHPETTLSSFIAQRLRWGTKSSAYKEWQTQAALFIAWIISISIVISGLSSLLTGNQEVFKVFVILLSAKALGDFPLLLATSGYFGQRSLMKWFMPLLVLHILYVALIGLLSIVVKKYVWKGRKVQ